MAVIWPLACAGEVGVIDARVGWCGGADGNADSAVLGVVGSMGPDEARMEHIALAVMVLCAVALALLVYYCF